MNSEHRYETIVYLNTIVPPMPDEVEHAVVRATHDQAVKVIVRRGAGHLWRRA